MVCSPVRKATAPPAFREGPAPTRAEIASVAARVEKRMRRWLRHRGLLDERAAEALSNETPELSPLEACMQMSLFGSTYVRLAGDGAPEPLARAEARFRAAGKGPWVAEASGFNVHAGVTVRSGDREGLERLCRCCARPECSLERLSILADGRAAYLLRKPRRNGATHLVMTPVQFLSLLSSLIPPPGFHSSACRACSGRARRCARPWCRAGLWRELGRRERAPPASS
jgi:putative transposase